MHICFICTEIFAWGKFGGFGRATRMIGCELAKRGINVSALIPRRQDQKEVEVLDGITVYGYEIKKLHKTLDLFRKVEADIYHSEEPSFGTYLAQKLHPEKKHMVTFRDTRLLSDWITEFRLPSLSKVQVFLNWIYEDNCLVHSAVRKADKRFAAANLIKERAKTWYHLKEEPKFLPTPVQISASNQKAQNPTVCFLARWDRRKRPEIIIELAKSFPQVHFIMAGSSRDKVYDQFLRSQFTKIPNIELTGFINQFDSDRISTILSQSWILINTAAREGLPNAFIEACAHQCAVLSEVNPDGFASNFGYWAGDGDFNKGLIFLLENDRWRQQGEKGYQYVKETFDLDLAVDQHIEAYQHLLSN